MEWIRKIAESFIKDRKKMDKWHWIIMACAVIVVFATTYALVMPVITIDKETSMKTPGMYLESDADASSEEYTASDSDKTVDSPMLGELKKGGRKAELNESTESIDDPRDDSANKATEAKQETNTETKAPEKKEAEFSAKATDNSYRITVKGDKASGLTGAETMHVKEIHRTEDLYKEYVKKLNGTLNVKEDGQIKDMRLFTLEFLDQRGDSVHLKGNVEVTIDFTKSLKADQKSQVRAFSGIKLSNTDWVSDKDVRTKGSGDNVREIRYTINKDGITGVAVIGKDHTDRSDHSGISPSPANVSDHKLTASGEDYKVTVYYDDEANIPEDAKLKVEEIKEGTDEYEACLDHTKETYTSQDNIRDVTDIEARFFDITIMDGKEEVQPEAPVDVKIATSPVKTEDPAGIVAVSITENVDEEDADKGTKDTDEKKDPGKDADTEKAADKAADDADAKAADKKAEDDGAGETPDMDAQILNAEVKEGKKGVKSVEYETDSLGANGIIYRVDLEYEVDGEILGTYTCHLDGGSSLSLTDLAEKLGIPDDFEDYDSGKDFVSDIDDVEFADEDLIKITHKKKILGLFGSEDWILRSERPFAGKKELIITLEENKHIIVNIDVEDDLAFDLGTASITSLDGRFIPEDTEGHAEVLSEKEAKAAQDKVEKYIDDQGESAPGSTVRYTVLDIDLDLDASQLENYEKGFAVDAAIPEIEGKDFRLYHVHGNKVEEIPVVVSGADADGKNRKEDEDGSRTVNKVSFETPNFSEFVLRYTVDFTYEADGVVYYYSIEGGSTIPLADLLSYLGIDISTDLIESVDVSNSRLISVTFEGGQWMLTSLKPFTSEETLTILLVDGSTITIKITDDQPIDLRSTITHVKVEVDGEEVPDGSPIVNGRRYDLTIGFQETDDVQFSNDSTEMLYDIPAGINIPPVNGTFEMDFGGLGKLENNKFWVDDNGKLHVQWNTSVPEMLAILRAADRAHFEIELQCVFDETTHVIEWNEDVQTHLDLIDPHDVSVKKEGRYDSTDDKIHYTVTIESEGSTSDIVVTDAITGTALKSDVETVNNITVTRHRNGTTETVTPTYFAKTDNGFELKLPNMADGDTYVVEYTASVDYTKLGQSGKTTYLETNNGVKVKWDENPDPEEDNSYEYEINYSSLSKTATNVSDIEVGEDGKKYRTITWEIEANKERKVPVTFIKDSIRADSRDHMKMSGDGLTIIVTKENGTQTRILSWETQGLTKTDDWSWIYNPPETDGIASYKISYQTRAEVTEETYIANNDVEDDHDTSAIGVPVADKDAVVKTVTSVSEEETDWAIDITVPAEGTNYTQVIDELPYYISAQDRFFDLYKSCTVTGLIEGQEGYDISFEHRKYTSGSQWNFQTITDNNPTPPEGYDVTAKVFIDFYHIENDQKISGLIATGEERNIHVAITTENNEDWLKAAAEADSPTAYWNLRPHINSAKFGNITATAEAHPAIKKIEKDYKNTGTVKLNDGNTYSYYQYTLTLTDVKDGRNQIFDTFDTDVFEVLDLNTLDSTEYLNNNPFTPDKDNGHGRVDDGTNATTFVKADSHTATFTPTSTGVVISTEGLDKTENGVMYDCYKITYYLVLKHPEVAEQKALAAGGQIKFTNRVNWDGAKSEVDIEYGTPILDKSSVIEGNKAKFTIVINPNKIKIGPKDEQGNYLDYLTLKDTFSSTLSIDYSSIHVTTDPEDADVSYDYSGRTGTFRIPNETKVVITYTCNIIALGNVQVYNKATMEGLYEDYTEEYEVVESEGHGEANILYLDLLKYAADHMEDGSLAGAVFRLLDSEKNPVRYTARVQNPQSTVPVGTPITFTTTSEGMVHILLSQYDHGVTLKRNTVYYLEEIVAPTGKQLDPTLYSFVISDDPTQANYSREDGVWVYYNGDILKIRNNPEKLQLQITKRFSGNVDLTNEQKNKIRFLIQQVDENGNVIQNGFSRDISYNQMSYGKYSLTEEDGLVEGFYKVTEYHEDLGLPDNVVYTTSYTVTKGGTTNNGDGMVVNLAEVSDNQTTNIIFTNKYATGAYYFTKLDAGTEQPVAGAEFSVFKPSDPEHAVTTYTTGADGKFMITREKPDHSLLDLNTLYYVKETKAADGYVKPNPAPEYYFYFGEEGVAPPEGAVGHNAINLTRADSESAHETVLNRPETSIMVKKEWKHVNGTPLSEAEIRNKTIDVTLKRKISKLDAVTVTINVLFNGEISETKSYSDVKRGSPFTIGLSIPGYYSIGYQGNEYSNSQQLISLDEITGDTTIALTKTNQWAEVINENTMSVDYTSASGYSEPIPDDTFTEETKTLSILNNWYYLWNKLPKASDAGELYYYYVEENAESDEFTITYDNNGGIQEGLITVTNTKQEEDKGDLEVSKKVLSDAAAHLNTEFTFTVTLNDTTINGTYGDMVFENGVATFKLKHNEKKTAIGLPIGITYTVVEANAEGFTLTGKTGDTGTISTTMSKAEFTNTPVGSLAITKNIYTNGQIDSTKTGTFYFAVYKADDIGDNGLPKDGVTAVKTASIEVTQNGTKTVTVSDLPYGTYYVYELNQNGTPIVSGNNGSFTLINGTNYTVIGSGTTATVGAAQPAGTEGGNGTGTTAGNEVTVTNEITEFEFYKKWIDINQQEIEWDKDIEVTVQRFKSTETVDDSFSLKYTIAKSEISNGKEFTPSGATGPKLKLTIVTQENVKKYNFKIEGLEKSGADGVYTYFVKETNTQLEGYMAPSYVNTSAPTGTEAAYNSGGIVNKQVGGYELPQAGGIGTTLFTVFGSILVMFAAALLWRRRRYI